MECDTLYLHGLSRISYEEKAAFPDPAKSVLLDIRKQLKKPWTACGVSVAYDQKSGVTSIKFPSLDAMQKGLSRERMDGSFSGMYLLSDVGNGFGLFEVAQLSINMSGVLTGGLYEAKVNKVGRTDGLAIGITVDGQKIQPLLWNGDAPFVTFSPKAKVVDFYATSKLPLSWQRARLDRKSVV